MLPPFAPSRVRDWDVPAGLPTRGPGVEQGSVEGRREVQSGKPDAGKGPGQGPAPAGERRAAPAKR